MTNPRRTLRHADDTDLTDDEHVADLLCAFLPSTTGSQGLCWVLADGVRPLPTFAFVDDLPEPVATADARLMTGNLADAATHFSDTPGLLLARRRPGPPVPTDGDLVWLHAAQHTVPAAGVRLLGVWLAAGSADPVRLDAPLP